MKRWLLALAVIFATSAISADDTDRVLPPNQIMVTVVYLRLTTTWGTTAPASALEYQVSAANLLGFPTRADAQARALAVVKDGVLIEDVAIPAHRIQEATVHELAF